MLRIRGRDNRWFQIEFLFPICLFTTLSCGLGWICIMTLIGLENKNNYLEMGVSVIADPDADIDEYVAKAWEWTRRDFINPPLLNDALDHAFNGIAYSALCDYTEEEHKYLQDLLQRMKSSKEDGTVFSFNQYMRATISDYAASKWLCDRDSLVNDSRCTEYGKDGYSIYFQIDLKTPSDVKSMALYHNDKQKVLVGNKAKFHIISLEQKDAREFFNEEMEDGRSRIDALMTTNDITSKVAKAAIQRSQRRMYIAVLTQAV